MAGVTFTLYGLLFVPLLAGAGALRRYHEQHGYLGNLWKALPPSAYLAIALLFVYAGVNFLLTFGAGPALGETYHYVGDSVQVLRDGAVVGALSPAAAAEALRADARGFSGHGMLFSAIGLSLWHALHRAPGSEP